MAKPKRKQKNKSGGKSGGGDYTPPPLDMAKVLGDLEMKIGEIEAAEGDSLGPLFGEVHKLLLKTPTDKHEVMRLIGSRDVDGLRSLVRNLQSPAQEQHLAADAPTAKAPAAEAPAGATPGEAAASRAADGDVPQVDHETMKKAMRAFRKRLKLVRLDHESKLGVGPMTGGRKADVDAIMAPRAYPDEVWEALVAAGELRHVGREFYQLTSEA